VAVFAITTLAGVAALAHPCLARYEYSTEDTRLILYEEDVDNIARDGIQIPTGINPVLGLYRGTKYCMSIQSALYKYGLFLGLYQTSDSMAG
jgi:hypothetical protein